MKHINLLVYVIAAILTLGPVAVRLATRSDLPPQVYDSASIEHGKVLFTHEFTAYDPLCPNGDGLGPVFNANSCVACHNQGGLGGSGDNTHNVTTFDLKRARIQGTVHFDATQPKFKETPKQVNEAFPEAAPTFAVVQGCSQQRIPQVNISQRNTPALFGAKLIDEIPDRVVIAAERQQRLRWGLASASSDNVPVGRARRLPDGRIGKFGWKAQSATLADFVQAACANELGLGNPGQAQPRPLGQQAYQAPGLDLTAEQCLQITGFIAALDRPRERIPVPAQEREIAHEGKQLFMKIGCADCHTPSLGSIDGLYSDLLMHRMGSELDGGSGSYNEPTPIPDSEDTPKPDEWRTPPLWGIAQSAPYLHDGRAHNLTTAIAQHGGQGKAAADNFQRLRQEQRAQVIAFLNTLGAP